LTGVQIQIPPFFQPYTENIRQDFVEGRTIIECLSMLVERFPELKSRLFNSENRVRRELIIYLNKSQIHPDKFSRPVKDGDQLYIAHVISGG
jgi:molybdopterin converting factor small subunit